MSSPRTIGEQLNTALATAQEGLDLVVADRAGRAERRAQYDDIVATLSRVTAQLFELADDTALSATRYSMAADRLQAAGLVVDGLVSGNPLLEEAGTLLHAASSRAANPASPSMSLANQHERTAVTTAANAILGIIDENLPNARTITRTEMYEDLMRDSLRQAQDNILTYAEGAAIEGVGKREF